MDQTIIGSNRKIDPTRRAHLKPDRTPDDNDRVEIGPTDIAFAESQGKKPGGNIFIRGEPNENRKLSRKENWTAGCIAVKNKEIEEIYAMVGTGTLITIRA